ncbi:uncharacterized protein SPAPADRAFT_63616, partial [Spathaspora passalidarum NRRL Y-27907]
PIRFFNKSVYLLQKEFHCELKELSKGDKDEFQIKMTNLSIKYNEQIKQLVGMFKHKYGGQDKREPPDILCDPISFNLLHDPRHYSFGPLF